MKILIVNGYQLDSKLSQKNYQYFLKTIKEAFEGNEVIDNFYIEREINELSDFVVDWEHEQLNYQAEMNCERFDEIDFIFIGGDMSILPWEPKSTQVVSLIHMAKYARKPLIGIGFGAFAVVYTLATKGARYHILNGPIGGTIESLPDFPHYSVGTGAFPSGWLDHETGDIYSYDRTMRGWMPVCNIGVHFVSTTGRPISKQVHSRGFDRPIEDASLIAGLHEVDEDTLKVTNLFLASPLINNGVIPLSKTFPVRLYHNWYFNRDSALPTSENLFIMAEGKYGPCVLTKDRMLLISCRLEAYLNVKYVKAILNTFIREMLDLLLSKESGKIDHSLFVFLFQKKSLMSSSPLKQSPDIVEEQLPSLVIENSKLQSGSITNSMVAEALKKEVPLSIESPVPTPKLPSQPRSGLTSAKTRIQTALVKERQVADHMYDTGQDRLNKAIPLSKQFVPTRLRNGPVKVDPPLLAIFYKPIRQKPDETVDYYALTGSRKSSSLGRRPRQIIQNPLSARQKRLELAFQSMGIRYDPNVIKRGLDGVTIEEDMPDYARDLLSGLAMKETSITTRRHRFQPGGSNFGTLSKPLSPAQQYPSGSSSPSGGVKPLLPITTSLPADEEDGTGESKDEEKNGINLQSRAGSPRSAITSKPGTSVTFKEPEDEDEDKDNFSLLSQQQQEGRKEGIGSASVGIGGRIKVPVIADWMKIYENTDIIPVLVSESERISRVSDGRSSPVTSSSNSARAPSTRQQSPIVLPTSKPNTGPIPTPINTAKPPKQSRGSILTPRTLRTSDTAKNVTSILHAKNKDFYLPVNHPKAIAKPKKEYIIDHSLIIAHDDSFANSPWRSYEEVHYLSTQSTASNFSSPEQQRENLIETGKVIFLPNKTIPIQSNYLKLQHSFQKEEEERSQASYQGLYEEPYLSAREREIKEYNQAKEKFIAGNFNTMFHHDTLELRKEGGVRPHGEYPKYPGPGYENLTAADWNFVKRDNKEEFLFGAWKK